MNLEEIIPLLEKVSEWRKNLQDDDTIFYAEMDDGNNYIVAEQIWSEYAEYVLECVKNRRDPGYESFSIENVKDECFPCAKTCFLSIAIRISQKCLSENKYLKEDSNELRYLICKIEHQEALEKTRGGFLSQKDYEVVGNALDVLSKPS